MSQHSHRRIVIVSAVSGVLVFGAAGFAAAATGSPRVKAPVIVPAAVTDPSISVDTTQPDPTTASSDPATSVGDDNGTEVENTDATEVENTDATEVDDESDDDDTNSNSGNSNSNSNGGGDDNGGGGNGGGGDD